MSTANTRPSIISVNVGSVREIETQGRLVPTGIYKSPIAGPVRAQGVNLEGDDQADRKVHGGPDKAIYGFPSEHYDSCGEVCPGMQLDWGSFGENLTTRGLLEDDAIIGARYQCGSVELMVTEPRMPCFKLAIRLGVKTAAKRMLETKHTGFYFSIVNEGSLQAGDRLEMISKPTEGLPVSALTDLYRAKKPNREDLQRALNAPSITSTWSDWIREKLER